MTRSPASRGRPTLVVFTLGAARESRRRRLLPAALGGVEEELHGAGLAAALAAGEEAGCDAVVSSPRPLPLPPGVAHRPQDGRDFGERLERAIEAARGRGDGGCGGGDAGRDRAGAAARRGDGRDEPGERPFLVVGTDVPGLASRHLAEALAALAADPDRVVLGPSPDGGFYLLAASRPVPGLGRMTRWCRPDTLARLRRGLAAAGRPVVLLSPLADLDRPRDLERWLAHRRRRGITPALRQHAAWRLLRSRLLRLLAALRRPPRPAAIGRPRTAPAPVRAARAPPPPA